MAFCQSGVLLSTQRPNLLHSLHKTIAFGSLEHTKRARALAHCFRKPFRCTRTKCTTPFRSFAISVSMRWNNHFYFELSLARTHRSFVVNSTLLVLCNCSTRCTTTTTTTATMALNMAYRSI